jgi:hypothetical protein
MRLIHSGKREYTGVRKFPCMEDGCGYRATRSGNLTRHGLIHSGKRKVR